MKSAWSWVLASFACGCSGAAQRVQAPEPSSPAEQGSIYDLHEWGLIDVYPTNAEFSQSDILGGPSIQMDGGLHLRPSVESPFVPEVQPSMRRKPVIYLHHVSGPTASVRLRVNVDSGRMLEVWPFFPEVTPITANATFDFAVESAIGCRVDADLPRLCTISPAPDGFCERMELYDYETSDANCLSIGGENFPFLFYRADRAHESLSDYPVGWAPGTTLRESDRTPPNIGPETGPILISRAELTPNDLARFYRIQYRSGSVRAISGTLVQNAVIPLASEASDRSQLEALCRQDLATLGLTTSESDAFMRAWADELFGGQGVADSDVLLYWLPASHHRVVSSIDATPAPRNIQRALMVRVQLTSQPT